MSAIVRNRTVGFYLGFYWMGIIMTMACLSLVVAGNSGPLYALEHTRFPLSWMSAGAAILSFLAAEFCHPAESLEREPEKERAEFVAREWETTGA
jgi:hypothetical protein